MADFGPVPGSVDGEVLIVGAGPTGLCLALAMRRLGVGGVHDHGGDAPRADPRAAVVWPREAELLASLGLGPRLRDSARPLGATEVFMSGRRLGELPFAGVASAFDRPMVIEQHVLQHLVEAELQDAGGRVRWRTRLTALTQTTDGVLADLVGADGSPETLRTSWLVGCDGARSVVRKALGITFPGRAAPNLEVVQVKADLDWPYDPMKGGLFLAPGRALGSFSMPDGRRRFYCFKTIEEEERTSAPTLEEMQDLIGTMMGRSPVRLRDAEWLSRARFQERIAERLRVGRVLLAGDAGHVWPAVGGHGMAVGILGACNLAWRLEAVIRDRGPVELLDAYGFEQRAQAAVMIRKMRFDLLERPLPAPILAGLATILPVALRSKAVRRAIERGLLSDLSLHHRSSPTSVSRAGGRLRAGDRLPDARVVVDGEVRRLHELLSIRRWTLIAPQTTDVQRIAPMLSDRAAICLIQATPADASASAELGRLVTMLLVRPDGYVAFTAAPGDLNGLAAYLAAWAPVRTDAGQAVVRDFETSRAKPLPPLTKARP